MGHDHSPHFPRHDTHDARYAATQRATWASVAVNTVMTLAQILVGWLAHSQSLIAHGLHSFSDLLSDFLVLYASRQSAQPADEGHPYGHGRVETAATLLLGVSLIAVGGGILWESGLHLTDVSHLQTVELAALWIAIATVAVKEGLYQYLIRVARSLRSPLLTANAMHTRADAASALAVVVGIAGALMGWGWLDLLAAALMGFMILRMGGELAWGALQELIDTGLDKEQVEHIRQTLADTPGVRGLHALRTRRMAHQALVDAHILVDARISVSEGHRIAESARQRVLNAYPDVLDVLVHIDPENDAQSNANVADLPERQLILAELDLLTRGLPTPERVLLHYLGGQVEAELFLSADLAPATLATLESEMQQRLTAHPYLGKLSLHQTNAPK